MAQTNRHVISALVANRFGVLNRISGLFSKRGYNIESLSVAKTGDDNYSRMTIVALEDESALDQIVRQLAKCYDVYKVVRIDKNLGVMRELLLIKINVAPEQRPEVESTIRTYKAKSIDLSATSQTIELTGESSKIDGFIRILEPYGIIEMARTGITALARGEESLFTLGQEI